MEVAPLLRFLEYGWFWESPLPRPPSAPLTHASVITGELFSQTKEEVCGVLIGSRK